MASCPFSPGPRTRLLIMAVGALAVAVPFLFWQQTWFGRPLTAEEIGSYLRDHSRPRRIQHALEQASVRLESGDPGAAAWSGDIAALARHPLAEIRATAAWAMGYDTRSRAFHGALLALLRDPDLTVRQNAALALVRFGDSGGRAELVRLLQPHAVQAPAAGRMRIKLEEGAHVGAKALLARIEGDRPAEVRAPAAGRIAAVVVQDGALVQAGDTLLSLDPDPAGAWEALRALYLVGEREDRDAVERYARGVPGMPERIRRQAVLTARAIDTRPEPNPTH